MASLSGSNYSCNSLMNLLAGVSAPTASAGVSASASKSAQDSDMSSLMAGDSAQAQGKHRGYGYTNYPTVTGV